MSTILLSFSADWFEKLEAGQVKFEYRKHFPVGETTVYFYVSNPTKAIAGIAKFAERQQLSEWTEKYANRSPMTRQRIAEYLADCRFAMPVLSFQKTNRISLSQLQMDIKDFIVPRMYYYLDDTPLLSYLEEKLAPEGEPIVHDFSCISDEDICK